MRKKFLISIMIALSIITLIFSTVYATDENTDYSNLPSSYDLRNDINIRVENQGQRGWCGAYAATKTIETYLQKTRGINYNLSEAYIAYSEAPYFGGDVEWKTDIETARALVRHSLFQRDKYVLESEIPNQDYSFNETNKQKFANVKPVVKSVEPVLMKDNEKIKKHIMTKGGVFLSIDSDKKWYNSSTNAIYCNEEEEKEYIELETREQVLKYVEETTNHAVTIIGWNDNYSRNNFNSSCRPNNDGAWLVLNSWGTDWGNNGTAWVSYEDEYFQHYGATGIEDITLRGELNVKFSYRYNGVGRTITANIVADDEIERIEGWSRQSDYEYTKGFTEPFEPYNIEIKSSVDGSTKVVEVNIPKEEFEKIQNQIEQEDLKRKEEQEKQTKERNIKLYTLVSINYVICIIILFVIIKLRKIYKEQKNKDIKSKSVLEKCVDIIWRIIKLIVKTSFIILVLIIIGFVIFFILALFIT